MVIQKPEDVFKELQDQSKGKRKRPVGIEGKSPSAWMQTQTVGAKFWVLMRSSLHI